MRFKQNLPLFIAFGLLTGGLLALAFFLQRPDEDLLHEAAAKYAATQGSVRDVQVHGTVADIEFAGRPTLFAEFAKQNGTWIFSRDLAAEFDRQMKDPATSAEILKRLAQRVSDQSGTNVTVREGIRYEYRLGRLKEGLTGEVVVNFSYPQGESRAPGRYRETFLYSDGQWQSQGVGSLFTHVPPRKK